MPPESISAITPQYIEDLTTSLEDEEGEVNIVDRLRMVDRYIEKLAGISNETANHLRLLALAATELELTDRIDNLQQNPKYSGLSRQEIIIKVLGKISKRYLAFSEESVNTGASLYPSIGFECETNPKNFTGDIEDYFSEETQNLQFFEKAQKLGLAQAVTTVSTAFPFKATPDYGANRMELITSPTINPKMQMIIFKKLANIQAVAENGWGNFHETIAGPTLTLKDLNFLKLRGMWLAMGYSTELDKVNMQKLAAGDLYGVDIWKKLSVVDGYIVHIPMHVKKAKNPNISPTVGEAPTSVIEQRSFEVLEGPSALFRWARKVHFDFYAATALQAKQGLSKLDNESVDQLSTYWDELSERFEDLNSRYGLPNLPDASKAVTMCQDPKHLGDFVIACKNDIRISQKLLEIALKDKYDNNTKDLARKLLGILKSEVNTLSLETKDGFISIKDLNTEDPIDRLDLTSSAYISMELQSLFLTDLNLFYSKIEGTAGINSEYKKEWRKISLDFRSKVSKVIKRPKA